MVKVDYVSGLNLDELVKTYSDYKEEEVLNVILTRLTSKENYVSKERGDWLIICGDISSELPHIRYCLNFFSPLYKRILYLIGAKEMHLVNNDEVMKYKYNSENKLLAVKSVAEEFTNVSVINNETLCLNGIVIAGSTNFYKLNSEKDVELYKSTCKDSIYLYPLGLDSVNTRYLKDQLFLNTLVDGLDLLVTYIPPVSPPFSWLDSSYAYNKDGVNINPPHWVSNFHGVTRYTIYKGSNLYINSVTRLGEFIGYPRIRSFNIEKERL